MKELKVYTVQELLLTPTFMGNQCKLANYLNIHRTTLKKYIDDKNNEFHSILAMNGGYVFMTIPSTARR